MLRAVLFCGMRMRRFAWRIMTIDMQPAYESLPFVSELASRQTPPIERNMVGAALRQTELPLLEFSTDLDEALFLGLVQGLQAGALGRRLPIDADGGMQQNQNLDNGVSPWLTHAATVPPDAMGPFSECRSLEAPAASVNSPGWPPCRCQRRNEDNSDKQLRSTRRYPCTLFLLPNRAPDGFQPEPHFRTSAAE